MRYVLYLHSEVLFPLHLWVFVLKKYFGQIMKSEILKYEPHIDNIYTQMRKNNKHIEIDLNL